MAALAGTRVHAERHVAAGADVIIAQGTEGGGHTGQIGSMVLLPEVVDAVAPVPVLGAAALDGVAKWQPPWPLARPASGADPCG